MTRTNLVVMSLVWLLALTASLPTAVADSSPRVATMDDIVKVFKSRQDRVKSAKFVWEQLKTEMKGSISSYLTKADPHFRQNAKKYGDMPPKDSTISINETLSISGENARYDRVGKAWRHSHGGYTDFQLLSSFFNGECRMMRGTSGRGDEYPQVSIRSQPTFVDAGDPQVRVITLAYRAQSEVLKPFILQNFTLTGKTSLVDGVRCVELVRLPPGKKVMNATTLWLAPERDYQMVRMQVFSEGCVITQHTVRYQQHSVHGWVPASWKWIRNNERSVLQWSAESTVRAWQINEPVADSELGIDTQPGGTLSDQRTDSRYVIKPDGQKRLIDPSEYGAKFSDLVRTQTGELAANATARSATQSPWLIWLVGAIGAVSFLGVLLRRLQTNK